MNNFFIETIEQYGKNRTKEAFIEINDEKEVDKLTYNKIVLEAKKLSNYFNENNLQNAVAVIYMPAKIKISIVILACMYSNITPIFKTISDTIEKDRFNYEFNELLKTVEKVDLIIADKNRLDIKNKCIRRKINFCCLQDKTDDFFEYKIKRKKQLTDLIIMTSGTTSSCKAVKINLENLKHCLNNCSDMWDMDKKSITLSWAPHSHVLGLITGYLLPMYVGGKSLIMSPKDFMNNPLNWLNLISKYKVTNCSTTLFGIEICNKLYDEDKFINFDLSNLKYIAIGGEIVKSSSLNQFNNLYSKYGFNYKSFSPSYGMTENSGVVCSLTKNDDFLEIKLDSEGLEQGLIKEDNTINGVSVVSVGKIPLNTYIYIIDKNDKILPPCQLGEIIISSPGLSCGYLNELDNKSFFKFKCIDGKVRTFFKTGDQGGFYKDELLITGRIKDIINIKGKKYSPYDIENIINKYVSYKLRSTVAFSVEINNEEKVIIYQEITKRQIKYKEKINKAIKEIIKKKMNLNIYDIVFLDLNSIPRTESKKIQRQQCKKMYKKIFLKKGVE